VYGTSDFVSALNKPSSSSSSSSSLSVHSRRLSITLQAFSRLDPAIECGSAQRLVQLRGCQTLALISNAYPVLRGATLTHALLLWNKYMHRSARSMHSDTAVLPPALAVYIREPSIKPSAQREHDGRGLPLHFEPSRH